MAASLVWEILALLKEMGLAALENHGLVGTNERVRSQLHDFLATVDTMLQHANVDLATCPALPVVVHSLEAVTDKLLQAQTSKALQAPPIAASRFAAVKQYIRAFISARKTSNKLADAKAQLMGAMKLLPLANAAIAARLLAQMTILQERQDEMLTFMHQNLGRVPSATLQAAVHADALSLALALKLQQEEDDWHYARMLDAEANGARRVAVY